MFSKTNAIAISWLAGLIDGEGCFDITQYVQSSGSYGFTPRIRIVLCDKDKFVLEKVQNMVGGKINFRDLSKSKNPKFIKTNNQYEWCITGRKNCQVVAKKLLPYLVLKRVTCIQFLDVCEMLENKVHLTEPEKVIALRKVNPARGI